MSERGLPDPTRGLLDTSVFIAQETGRRLRHFQTEAAVSVVTVAELTLGVLMADDPAARSRRLRTLSAMEARFNPLPIDIETARVFARLTAEARRLGRRPNIMDMWIAATAVANSMPVFTQDADFRQIPGVEVVLV